MRDTMVLVLLLPQARPMEDLDILALFVGDQDEGALFPRRAFRLQGGKDIGKGPADGAAFKLRLWVDRGGSLFLRRGHRSGASATRMAEVQNEQRLGGDGEGYLIGEELGDIEADESVGADGFAGLCEGPKAGMQGSGLSGETIEAVLDGGAGQIEGTGDPTEGYRVGVAKEEISVIDATFGVIIEGEGLRRKGFAAVETVETGDFAEGAG